MNDRNTALAGATEWVDTCNFADDLARLIAIQSESQNPDQMPELRRYLSDGIIPVLTEMGFVSTIHENPVKGASPILTAALIEDDAAPTVLIYGHGDVVAGQRGAWLEGLDPFRLTARQDRLYGRGSADNKAQHLINMAALRLVQQTRGRLGFNVKVIIEMGEEIGSPGLADFVQQQGDALAADVLIASDGPRLQPDVPTVFTGSRGAINFRLEVNLRDGAQHSGNWGGLLADPAMILAQALSTITDARGAIKIPEWRPDSLTPNISAMLRPLPVGGKGPALSDGWGEPGLSPAERVFGWNSFAVLAMESGVPDEPQNAIAGDAAATCQLRFVVGTDEGYILPSLRRHLDAHGFCAVSIVSDRTAAPATRLDPDNPWVRFTVGSFLKTNAIDPHVLPNLGGFIPNHVFSEILGLPTIWVPHSYAGCSQHAPNEHVLVPVIRDAARLMTGLFWDLGEGGAP